jgi:chromosome segregation ATPase
VSTAQQSDHIYASKSNNDSNSSASKSGNSNKHEQSEGAISGLSKLKRKLAEIDKERELYKIDQTKMEDEISTVTKSLSKLGDQMIEMRQDMTALSGSLCTELAEMKQILLGMSSKKTPSPRWKKHRRAKESEAASSSSNDKIMVAASTSPTEQYSRWDSMCESGAEQNGRPPPATLTLATLEDFDMNGVDTSIRNSDRDMRKFRDPNTHSKPSEASPTGAY